MGGDEVVVRFQFEADPCLYDSGRMFAIGYQRNKKEPDCVENMIFDSKDNVHGALRALLQVYPDFRTRATSFYDTATRITLETIGG